MEVKLSYNNLRYKYEALTKDNSFPFNLGPIHNGQHLKVYSNGKWIKDKIVKGEDGKWNLVNTGYKEPALEGLLVSIDIMDLIIFKTKVK